eukprot:13005238-Ditylum_brightwellii.AAC.1
MKRARFTKKMLGPFEQNCADHGNNSNPSCHPDYRTLAQKRLWGLLILEEKQWMGGLKAGAFCTISSGTVAKNTTLFPANVVGGADKTAN